MVAKNKSLEQRSVMRMGSTKSEIYRRMCDVYGVEYFSQRKAFKWAKHGFVTTGINQKDCSWCGNKLTLIFKKICAQRSIKKVILTVFWVMKDSSLLIS